MFIGPRVIFVTNAKFKKNKLYTYVGHFLLIFTFLTNACDWPTDVRYLFLFITVEKDKKLFKVRNLYPPGECQPTARNLEKREEAAVPWDFFIFC
jgi:hypothetical protein